MTIINGPILIVEDVVHILELLEVTLHYKGYQVETARNGQEALQRITGKRPSLIITDLLMPKMDGFALIYEVRTNPITSNIPIIVLSATYITPEDKNFALSLGAVRFLGKPVDTEEFLLTVAKVLASSPSALPEPMNKQIFCQGYRVRLENKLRHKINQIKRIDRLLKTLPEDQKSAFHTLREEAYFNQEEIQKELDVIYRFLEDTQN